MIVFVVLVLLAAFCAVMTMRAVRLLQSALWLAGVSISVALILYIIGATMMAVIELSLSVGLITILLVFAISMVGADSPDQPQVRPLNIPLIAAALLLLIGLTIPMFAPQENAAEGAFSSVFWEQREADVLAQIAIIFAGVLGVLGLLTEVSSKQITPIQTSGQSQSESEPKIKVVESETELEMV